MFIDTAGRSMYDAQQQRHRAEAQPTELQMNQTNNECSSSCSSERYGGAVTCDCKKSAACTKATPHFDYVSAETTKGIASMGLKYNAAVTFGVLTTDTIEQAIERAGSKAGNKGFEAMTGLIEIISLYKNIG